MRTDAPQETGPSALSGLLAHVARPGREVVDILGLRARKMVRRQLTAARRSDSRVRRTAYVVTRQTARRVVNAVTDRQVGWIAMLWSARWLEGTTYEITGWAYERGYGYAEAPRTRVLLSRPGSSVTVEAEVAQVQEMEVNGLARNAEFDYANTAFRATVDLSPVLADPASEPWQVHLEVTGSDGRTRRGTLKQRHRHSSARFLDARTFDASTQLVPRWTRRRGLSFTRTARSVVASDVRIDGRTLTVDLSLHDLVPVRAELRSRDALRPLALTRLDRGTARVSAEIPVTWVVTHAEEELLEPETDEAVVEPQRLAETEAAAVEEAGSEQREDLAEPAPAAARLGQHLAHQTYRIVLYDADGAEHVVGGALDGAGQVHVPGSGLLAYAGASGDLFVGDSWSHLVVGDVALTPGPEPRLRLSGSWGGPQEALTMTFRGRRQEIPVEVSVHQDGTWTGTADLRQSQWGGPAQLPRVGSYTLRATTPDRRGVRVLCGPSVIGRTPEKLPVAEARLRLEVGRGRALRLRVGLTRAADELGSFHQRRMDEAYLTTEHRPQRSVYLESFYGRLATCNPYAIDRVIARDHPEWTRYWGVTDLSVAVPEGAVPVVEGTQAWFDARATSRYVVANDWLRRRFVPQPFQTVLQTWHGSMFKRIGLDRPAVKASTREALLSEKAKWDVLLSQNHHSTVIFRSAYDWDGPTYEEGYPRNDPLSNDSGDAVRERLGIGPDQKAILYAPTWRDDVPGLVTFLDLQRLAADLGEDYVLMLRGHSRTVAHGRSVRQQGVVDVTTYPNITELFLAADAMITDYSSVMFDYSVTRRPMIFFVPDLDAYRDEVRGVYFDLADEAPGPVVRTQDEVLDAIRSMERSSAYAERYASWVQRFNAHDDGHSAERVVRRLFADHPADL